MSDAPNSAQRNKASVWQTIKAVAWSFLGVRKKSELEADMGRLNILHIIAVGVVGAVLFVLTLIALVNWVAAK